ncbi:MAG: CsbD family protein [Actinomyces urogenitalis]|uniref:CsbD family protein n=1 Tax=Actinomyces urogenitalis TaxID=103621 RepID=UPI00242C76C8|nr:CsbD family protein [Actinomyces urogenitalis]MCI7455897.1 CsbD family protein [Actinomyces urogenitalis]MDY3678872.1 CsbD family protein [Actinomyces urogenitalis]
MADSDATFDKLAGKAKETLGKLTGDKETETEGKLQNLEGKIAEKVDDVKDTVQGVVNRLKGDEE